MRPFTLYLELLGIAFSARAKYRVVRLANKYNLRSTLLVSAIQKIRLGAFIAIISLIMEIIVVLFCMRGMIVSDEFVVPMVVVPMMGVFIGFVMVAEAKVISEAA